MGSDPASEHHNMINFVLNIQQIHHIYITDKKAISPASLKVLFQFLCAGHRKRKQNDT